MNHPEIRMVPVDALVPYARNARTHSDAQVAQIAASITEFGWTNPILTDGAKGLIAGHGRLMAARKLGLKEVPVIELGHLTPEQKKAYILADNRLAENAGWDDELLKLELAELKAADFDLDLMGFTDKELEELLNGDESGGGLTEDDAIPEAPVDPVSRPGDLWILGNHRLLCGDSTVLSDVERLNGLLFLPSGESTEVGRAALMIMPLSSKAIHAISPVSCVSQLGLLRVRCSRLATRPIPPMQTSCSV
jgi:hypothetical protein